MTQTQKLLIAIGILAVTGIAANRFAPAGKGDRGDACRRFVNEARRTCYSQLLSERLKQHGVADAVATLDNLAARDVDVAEHAHEFAHGLGIEAYGTSTDIVGTFAACGDGFSSGCRHGVIQAYFESREKVTQPEVEALCQPFKSPGASRWVLFQCVHGMGHGLTMLYAHDLLYPCSIMADRYLHACYQMQTSVMLNLNHGNMEDAAKSCELAPATVRPVCFQSLGRDITSYTSRDPQKTADMCNKAAEPYRPSCYFGAAKALVDWTATTDAALAFCRIVGHEAGGPTCYQALGEEIATLLASGPEREEQCQRAQEPQAVMACRLGAGVTTSR